MKDSKSLQEKSARKTSERVSSKAVLARLEDGRKQILNSDRKLARVIEAVGPCKLKLMEMHDCFETLLESIVYQQLTGKAAATIMGRVKSLYADSFPTPAQVLETADDELRSVGLSRAKTLAIKDLSLKTIEGRIPSIAQLHEMDDESIIEALTAVRGIGEWTVQMLLIFKLGRPDVMPSNDYGVRKGYALVFKRKELPTPKELLLVADKWRPYRTVAAWYFWRALELP